MTDSINTPKDIEKDIEKLDQKSLTPLQEAQKKYFDLSNKKSHKNLKDTLILIERRQKKNADEKWYKSIRDFLTKIEATDPDTHRAEYTELIKYGVQNDLCRSSKIRKDINTLVKHFEEKPKPTTVRKMTDEELYKFRVVEGIKD